MTATVAGTPNSGPQATIHGPPTAEHTQEIQTFVPTSVSQVQLIGPPPALGQVQYQIQPAQSLHIQGIPSIGSQASAQPITQMYVMSQPPPQPAFMSSGNSINGAVSYVCAQPSVQRTNSPSSSIIETVNVNLQQPPPSGMIEKTTNLISEIKLFHFLSASLNINQQQPPPSLLQLHFPPPFPPNHPPPTIAQTYQIQYQQVETGAPPTQTQFVIQHGEHPVQQTHELTHIQQHFEGQSALSQIQIQGPPPTSQTFMMPSNIQQPPSQDVQYHQDGMF